MVTPELRVVDFENMNSLVAWMRRQGVRRLRLPDGLEIETAAEGDKVPTAADGDAMPVPVPSAFAAQADDLCACGHSWPVEHFESGCLHGCSHEVCMSKATAEPEPGAL